MKESDFRKIMAERSDRTLRHVKQNNNPRDFKKSHLAKPGLKGVPHGPNRHPS